MSKQLLTRPVKGLAVLALVVLTAAACQDLDVTNLNQPDRDRALQEPEDLQALIAGTFDVFLDTHTSWPITSLIPALSSEQTSTSQWQGVVPSTIEPRPQIENSSQLPAATGPHGPQTLWSTLSEVAANVHDGLRVIENQGITIMEGDQDVTPRARAFAKFMQGVAWGYMAMLYDQALIIPETEELRADIIQQGIEALTDYPEALGMAIQSIDEAIAIANANTFTFPSSAESALFFTTPEPLTSDEFARVANTVAARLIVLSARTPQERATLFPEQNLTWQRVLDYTDNGLLQGEDLRFRLASSFRSSFAILFPSWEGDGCADCQRLDYRTTGPADISGQYQDWINGPVADRRRFDIETPDRRVTGLTPQSPGAYIVHRENNNGFRPETGLWRFSAYQYARHGRELGLPASFVVAAYQMGHAPWVRWEENVLLRAEAFIHTNQLGLAADEINITRTRSHTLLETGAVAHPGLPAVTADGVPESADCVPRTDNGACGDLYTALRYERGIELATSDALRAYADHRGFGILPDGTPLHFAVSGLELEVLGLPIYSFGGPGTEWGAVYDPVTLD